MTAVNGGEGLLSILSIIPHESRSVNWEQPQQWPVQ